MPYTYDDFVSAAQNAGLYDSFSQDDLSIAQRSPEYGLSMLKLQQDANNATTEEQKLLVQEAVNQLRSTYGTPTSIISGNNSFNYDQQDTYQKALDNVVNYGSFSYDHNEDPQYSALRKSYLREGQRSMKDTMAKAATATGGVPSSYAVTAAQQANDYYNTQLNDVIPTLQQNAYERYLQDFGTKLSELNTLETDRNFDYAAYLQDYQMQLDRFNNALTLYNMGQRTEEIANILGIPYVAASVGSGSGGSGSGGSGSGGSGSGGRKNSDSTNTPTYDSILENSIALMRAGAKYAEIKAYQTDAVQNGYISENQQAAMMRTVTDVRDSRS